METTFYHLPLNLQQGFIHLNDETVCNTVIAIYDRHREKMIVRPEFYYALEDIQSKFIFLSTFRVEYGDGFSVDTWDNRLSGK